MGPQPNKAQFYRKRDTTKKTNPRVVERSWQGAACVFLPRQFLGRHSGAGGGAVLMDRGLPCENSLPLFETPQNGIIRL